MPRADHAEAASGQPLRRCSGATRAVSEPQHRPPARPSLNRPASSSPPRTAARVGPPAAPDGPARPARATGARAARRWESPGSPAQQVPTARQPAAAISLPNASSGRCTCREALQTAASMALCRGTSCTEPVSRPRNRRSLRPVRCRSGVPAKRASTRAGTALAAPGPVFVTSTPQPAGHPGIGIGHVTAAGLSAHHDEADGIAPPHGVEHRNVVDRGDAKRR